MNDDELSVIFEIFKRSENKTEIQLPSFRIVSDHNIFSISFTINDNLFISREKGKTRPIFISRGIDTECLMAEAREALETNSIDYSKSQGILK